MENEAWDVWGVLSHCDVAKPKYSISIANQFKLI